MTFRPLVEADLPLLHRWLNEPGVVAWWEGDDVTWSAVVRDYGSGGADGTEHWVIVADEVEVGWIQCYPVLESPEELDAWSPHLGCGRAGGIDYLLGEPERRGTGLGSQAIAAFVDQIVLGQHPEWDRVAASPYEANYASWRALARADWPGATPTRRSCCTALPSSAEGRPPPAP